MNDTTRESQASPLDEVLRSIPDEAPPPDLESRIMGALRDQRRVVRSPRRPTPRWLPPVLAAAALVVMIFSTQLPRMMGGAYRSPASQEVAGAPAPAVATGRAGPASVAGDKYKASAPADTAPLPVESAAKAGAASGGDRYRAFEAASPPSDMEERPGALHRAIDRAGGAKAALRDVPPPSGAPGLPKQFEAPASPWRDTSGDRQMIRGKQLDVEVKKVEDAYDRSKTIIEKAHGVITSEDMDVRRNAEARAKLTARVPVDQIDGVIAQLRELGKVLRLSSDSADRTKEYYGEGDVILEGGASEDDLVKKYEAETDSYRKQQLLQQIKSLRDRMKGQKGQLSDLSEQTHSVLLELTLIGRKGPVEFLPEAFTGLGQAALWILVTGIFWGPLAIASWVLWRRSAADRA